MQFRVFLGLGASTLLLGTLMYCSPTATTGTSTDAGVCDPDTGNYCPCDPSTYKPSDCYTGPKGTNGKGICKAGKRSCNGGVLTECVGEVVPRDETCNYADDDCNGIADDLPELADAEPIAYCNSPACDPNFTDAGIYCYTADLGICSAGRKTCANGAAQGQPNGCESFIKTGVTEVCNKIDDDCNGVVDDGPPETCNGIDDDCNGKKDDGTAQQLCGSQFKQCIQGQCIFVCPYVFSFDGEKFAYETSVGGASVVGQKIHLTEGKEVDFAPMWARLDHVKLDWTSGLGTVHTKVIAAEDEIVYLDAARLEVVEHDPGFEVLTSTSLEWNTLAKKDPQQLYALRTASLRAPLSATWMGRVDVTAELGRLDRRAATYDLHAANYYDMDFGAVRDASHARVVIDGWKYKEPRTLASGVVKERPHLDVKQKDGTYAKAMDLAAPRGDDKPVSFDLSRLSFPTGRYEFRVVTGTHEGGDAMWYVDRIRLTEEAPGAVVVHEVPLATGSLSFMGPPTEPNFGDHAHPRIAIDDGKGELLPEQRTWGAFTRYGDVRDLLSASDDRMVVMRRGDGVELRFDGIARPAPGKELAVFMMTDLLFKPRKWLTSRTGTPLTENVEPLPYHGMGHYPPDKPFPSDAAHQGWRAQYETRTYVQGDPRWGK